MVADGVLLINTTRAPRPAASPRPRRINQRFRLRRSCWVKPHAPPRRLPPGAAALSRPFSSPAWSHIRVRQPVRWPEPALPDGQALIDQGRYKKAVTEFTCVIQTQPSGRNGYRGRIEAQLLL